MASNSEGGTRKLAAIMFTDVKDFSKKMGENELAAMEVLKVHDDTMRDVVEKYRGTIIKSLGDSFMVDFPSAVNAVQCAIEAQERFWEHNKGKAEFDKIQIRVGIHLGDVMKVGNDIYGDGVNIAARIEAITEPNRISVSAEIYNQVKNKMPVKVYNVGMTDLKNIAEPVEVFEILLDSIPELAEPSESAKSLTLRKRTEQISLQEQEEASKVEAARKKVDDQKEKEEAEKRERANAHYSKALEYFQADEIAKAEEEVKEIYRIVQIHYEAQMLVIQIEERRAQLEEEQRRQRVKEEKLRKEEERKQKIQGYLDVALRFVEREQFAEAFSALQEVYTLEPNNEQAKRIEKQVQLAEEAVKERQRLEAQAEEERAREAGAEIERQRAEELANAALQRAAMRKEVAERPKTRLYIGIAAGVAVLAIVVIVTLLLTRGSLQKPTVIAVLPFTAAQEDYRYLGDAFSVFLSQELNRTEGLTVIAPTSSRKIDASPSNLQQLATSLGLSHIVHGTVTFDGATVSVNAQCLEVSDGTQVWQRAFQADVRDFASLAAQVNTALLQELETEVAEGMPRRISGSVEATTAYLHGIALMTLTSVDAFNQGAALFREALQYDSLFSAATGALSWALIEQYKRGGEQDGVLLSEATSLARKAAAADPNRALSHLVLGATLRENQRFVNARNEIEKCFSIQPENADGYRELALLALVEGNAEEALEHADRAIKIDPYYFDSQRVKGIAYLYRSRYKESAQAFDQALRLGAPDSILTVHFRFRTWISLDQASRIIDYCQPMMNVADDQTRVILYYWIGRAYQLEGNIECNTVFDEGLQLADRVYSQNPRDYKTLSYYALLQARRAKNPELAERLVQRALAIAPNSARTHYWAARVHAIRGKKAEALKELANAVAIEYSFPEILDADFLSVHADPQFTTTIVRKTR